jgi:hypothetical protein
LAGFAALGFAVGVPLAQAETRTFTYTGSEQTFTVPTGVSQVTAFAVGGKGGHRSTPGVWSSLGAEVTGEVGVLPEETLYIEVGGNGSENGETFNGGGQGDGGGASDLRTSPRAAGLSPDTRLIVAGGGGGGGLAFGAGKGGNAGEAGESGMTSVAGEATGGGAGTQSVGGRNSGCILATGAFGYGGEAGVLGRGGDGARVGASEGSGGGGGGGYYGGGGGAFCQGPTGGTFAPAASGGGGGSSLVPAGGSVVLGTTGAEPEVQLSWSPGATGSTGVSGPTGATGPSGPTGPTGPIGGSESLAFNNWSLSGSLTDKKLGQPITLPAGSTFNGAGELNTETGVGSLSGNLAIPAFTAPLKLFGVLPVELGVQLTPEAIAGTLAKSETVSGDETLTVPLKLGMDITSISLLGLDIPTACLSAKPLALGLVDNLTREELAKKAWSFAGSTTIPRLKCEGGLLGGLFGVVLSALLSGPENAYAIHVTAPGG